MLRRTHSTNTAKPDGGRPPSKFVDYFGAPQPQNATGSHVSSRIARINDHRLLIRSASTSFCVARQSLFALPDEIRTVIYTTNAVKAYSKRAAPLASFLKVGEAIESLSDHMAGANAAFGTGLIPFGAYGNRIAL